ncbi:hypothetical protein OG948_36660 (plasmid) [Embleya sp. NBC_00888]|uniref:hypothetical protein n=1 Tax=Embleya sp. NBC_00888 TaxID=2975960 RepID=UPI00386C3A3B|nr:hypothetical protein OG948_36660 [Embleya sp. NBC_00888]
MSGASRTSGGPLPADEATRFCRTIANSNAADWAMPLATVAALLDLLSLQP